MYAKSQTPSGCTIDFSDPKTAFHRCGIKEDYVVQLHEVYQQVGISSLLLILHAGRHLSRQLCRDS